MILDDFGVIIRGTEFGPSTGYCPTAAPDGLNSYEHRFFDQARGGYAGDVSGIEVVAARTFSFSWIIKADGTDPRQNIRDCAVRRRAAASAFSPPLVYEEVELQMKVPGAPGAEETLRYYGRPRGINVKKDLVAGFEAVLATFRALDPYGYGPQQSVVDSSSPATVTNLGDASTDRFTIAITGNGGSPVVTSTTDGNNTIAYAVPGESLAGGQVVTWDFRRHTATMAPIGDVYDLLAPGPEWFMLRPGVNTITFSGCASIEVTWRDAYL